MKKCLGVLCLSLLIIGGLVGSSYAQPSSSSTEPPAPLPGGKMVVVVTIVPPIELDASDVPILESGELSSMKLPEDPGPQQSTDLNVPEPSTFILFGLGIIGIIGIIRRKKI